jgi:hypothetical protein
MSGGSQSHHHQNLYTYRHFNTPFVIFQQEEHNKSDYQVLGEGQLFYIAVHLLTNYSICSCHSEEGDPVAQNNDLNNAECCVRNSLDVVQKTSL